MSRRNNGGGRRLPSPKKRKPIRPNPFVQSDIEDAERTLKWLRKEDMSRELQWIDSTKHGFYAIIVKNTIKTI